jgi:antirestriction protein ArdC
MRASSASSSASPPIEWSALLADAVSKPGVIHSAYQRFWSYSTGNQLLAWFQCVTRKLDLGPINTFLGWIDCGRHVKKGEKAITLCMPVTVKRKSDERSVFDSAALEEAKSIEAGTYTRFIYRAHWFVLCQTEGKDYVPADLPEWNEARALSSLGIERIAFVHPDGNCQGYAQERKVSVSPIAFAPHRTLFHELAHVLLGHTAELGKMDDTDITPRNLREVEAEGVALICTESLGLGTSEYSRGYLQHWLQGQSIPEKSAHRIFKAADQILKAGHPAREGGGHGAA